MTEQQTSRFLSHQLSFDYVGLTSTISGSAALEREDQNFQNEV